MPTVMPSTVNWPTVVGVSGPIYTAIAVAVSRTIPAAVIGWRVTAIIAGTVTAAVVAISGAIAVGA
jgi:hypothetical protein